MGGIGVIYLSISGNTHLVAREIKKIYPDIELIPIIIREKIPRTKLLQVIKYGYKTIFNRHIDYSFDLEKADRLGGIIIGSPVWMGRIPSPLRDVISTMDLKNKSVAGFCTYDNDPGDFKDQLFAFTDSPPFAWFLHFKEPMKKFRKEGFNDLQRDLVLSFASKNTAATP